MKRESKTALLWKFFSLTFLLTWICWIPAGILSQKGPHVYVTVLHYAGGIMPMLSALILLRLRGSHEEIKSYFWRLIDFRRIRGSGYALTLLTIPVLTGIGVGIDVLLGGQGAEPEYAATLANAPLALIPFIFATLVFGPLPEEMAWRGYALDRMQEKWSPLGASLILGAAWTLWHLPLFFIEGSYQSGLGVGTTQFWLYMLDKIPQSIFMTWIFNHNKRSILTAVLFHLMINFTGEMLDLSLRAETFYTIGLWASALIVTMIWKLQKPGLENGTLKPS